MKRRMNNLKTDLLGVIKIMSESSIPVYASSTAFFIFLSIIPLLVLFFTVIDTIPAFNNFLVLYLVNAFSSEVSSFIIDIINKVMASSPGILSVSAILILWSAGKGMQYLGRALNNINGTKETRFFLIQRLEGCGYTVILILMLAVLIVISMFGTLLLNIISLIFKVDLSWIINLLQYRFLVEWILFSGMFSLVYAWLPRKKVKPHKKWKGALFAGVTITLFSWGFAFYIENIYSFTLYGSLATIIILNVWIYVSCYLFLTGAAINHYSEEKIEKKDKE